VTDVAIVANHFSRVTDVLAVMTTKTTRRVEMSEGLYEYDTGLMPKITFGPNRRIGALGAYVVTLDPEKKLFPASLQWIAVE